MRLYRELSWIFFHKVGRWSDDMHWYYKRQLAMEWQLLLSSPPQGSGRQRDGGVRADRPGGGVVLPLRPPAAELRGSLDALADEVAEDDRLLAERLRELKWASAERLEEGLARLMDRTARSARG